MSNLTSKTQLTLEGDGGMGGDLYFEHASNSFAVNLNGQLMFLSLESATRLRDYLSTRLSHEPTPAPLADREEIAQDLRAVEAFLERAQSMRHSLLIAAAMADRAPSPPTAELATYCPHCKKALTVAAATKESAP